ncbi:MAG: T9SS type A sorting domain-containing protein, partial [Aureispira sp.]|nr:T9SS type A sorting domain-containing protein [Aureispira sp.]
VNIPFYLEAKLLINTLNSFNNSVQYLAPPIVEAEVGIPFRYNVSGFDPDGDVLIYDLVSPKQDIGQIVPNYFLPDTVSVDFLSGEFTWFTPQIVGSYVFTIRVQEYRNNILVGTTIVDYQLNVIPAVSNFQWDGNATWLTDTLGDYSYTLPPNTPIQLNLSYTDNGTNVSLEAFSETLSNNTATQSNYTISSTKDSIYYQWTPVSSDARCHPYVITFRGHSNYTGRLYRDLTVKIFVRDNTTSNCDTLLNQLSVPIQKISTKETTVSTTVTPNPFQAECIFKIQSERAIEEVQLFIFNSFGTQISTHQFHGNRYSYNNSNLAAGLYIYTIKLPDGRISSGKIVKI